MKCPKCGNENDAQYSFCLICGEELKMPAQSQSGINTVANTQLENQLERKRKQAVTSIAKLYTATAKKMRLPQLLTFDASNPALQPEAVVRSIDTPVLEKMEAQTKNKLLSVNKGKWFILKNPLSIILLAVAVVGFVFGTIYGIVDYIILTHDGYYWIDLFYIPSLIGAVSAVLLIALAFLVSSRYKSIAPYITAELARRAAQPEEQEEPACRH